MIKSPRQNAGRYKALRGFLRPVKARLNLSVCAAIEHWISAGSSYDILVLFGMRRSGNHLVINWILEQVPGSAVFYNNIRRHGDPFDVGMREYRLRFPNTRPKIILSYEDLTPDEVSGGPLPGFLSDRTRMGRARVQCGVILRDPYNLFASRLKKWPERLTTGGDIHRQQDMYVKHAALAAGEISAFGSTPVIPILFNQLLTAPRYRSDLAGRLGINSGDAGLDKVPVYGHGSSFDGYDTAGTHLRSGVFDRWRGSLSDPRFQHVTSDARLRKLAKDIFGMDAPDPPLLNTAQHIPTRQNGRSTAP